MSNPPTIITSPSPLIANQPGSINYYVNISDNSSNIFPAPSTTYSLKNSSGTTLSTFTSQTNCEDITSNYQNPLTFPASCAFDNNGYFYLVDYNPSNIITAYNPSFNQTTNLTYVYQPIGIKINSANGCLYIVNLVGSGTQFGAITILSPLHNSSLNPGASNYTYSYLISTTGAYSNYLNYPYDIVFDNSGNAIVSNNGYFISSPATGCFIVKFIIKNNIITSAVPLIYNSSTGNPLLASPSWSSGTNDPNFSSPSGMAYDLSRNLLYVANTEPSTPTSGQITIYNINGSTASKVYRAQEGFVGNNAYPPSSGVSVTSLQLDSYGNVYYLWKNGTSIEVRAFYYNGTTIQRTFGHTITNSANLLYYYGLALFNGNIYVTGAVTGNKTSVIKIETAFTFNNTTLSAGQSQSLSIYNGATFGKSFNISIPGSNTLISNNLPRYTNQASILTYYDNPNSANYLVPSGGTTYKLNDTSSQNLVDSVTMITNNEILYAPYNNELGSLSYPISMDFDGSGNLYDFGATFFC